MSLRPTEIIQALRDSPTIASSLLAKELRKNGNAVFDFGVGEMNPAIEVPLSIKDGIIQALNKNETFYCDPKGDAELLNALSEDFKLNFDLEYSPSQISICSGPKDALSKTFMALLSPFSSRNQVLVFAPVYEAFLDTPFMLTGKRPIILETNASFLPNVGELSRYLNSNHSNISMVIVNSPNNPSGCVYPDAILKELANVIQQYPEIAVICDEVYRTISYTGEKYRSIAHYLPQQTLLVGGMSKEVSGTGLRIGFIAGPETIIKAIVRIQGSFSSSVNLPTQKGYAHFLKMDTDLACRNEIRDILKRKRDLLIEQFRTLEGLNEFQWEIPQGAFYFFPCIERYIGKIALDGTVIRNDLDFVNYALRQANVVLLPGSAFSRENHVRLAYASMSLADIIEGCTRLSNALISLRTSC